MPSRSFDLSEIAKAYDIRGVVPDQLDEEIAERAGAAFVRLTDATHIVTGYDMRPSSPGLAAAFARGATSQGADVTEIGLASTDELYFASGSLDVPGAMFTASHNPAKYNGIKMCRAGARPVGAETGLADVRRMIEQGVPASDKPAGTVSSQDLLPAYAEHLRSLVGLEGLRPLTVVVDAGNGMAGHTVPAVLDPLPLTVVPLYFELDGTFPHHEANPIDPANLVDLQAKVREVGADLGLAFDGDADRCFVVDEHGAVVSPSALTALIATRELAKERAEGREGVAVIHNLITSRAVPEIVEAAGGRAVRTRVGHSFIKATMAETGAVFGGEHSGHFYFRDFWRADSGMLAALHVIAALGSTDKPLSELVAEFARYSQSGEINSEVADAQASIAAVREHYAAQPGLQLDELDGLTVSGEGWWFNLRPSNTEPLLRLNVEGDDEATMVRVRDEVLARIRTPESSPSTEGNPEHSAGLPAWVLEVVRCPADTGELDVSDTVLTCRSCGRRYPVRDGIPVLLVDEALPPAGQEREA
ncbi:MAG: phosphomannomutase/phosphoglucomutase [Actinomycetales bacterium]